MEEEKLSGGAGVGTRTGNGGSGDSSRASSLFLKSGDRQMFAVELGQGETTIVSWKKLVKDANKVNGVNTVPEPPANPIPAVECRIDSGQPIEDEVNDATAPNRFNAVIEKIERLYMGKDSSDEEDLIPDDDQYDTEDSFIDDTELDEYFEVDDSTTKHDGFFVNRGKLEPMDGFLDVDDPFVSSYNEGEFERNKKNDEKVGRQDCRNKNKKSCEIRSSFEGRTTDRGEDLEDKYLRSSKDGNNEQCSSKKLDEEKKEKRRKRRKHYTTKTEEKRRKCEERKRKRQGKRKEKKTKKTKEEDEGTNCETWTPHAF